MLDTAFLNSLRRVQIGDVSPSALTDISSVRVDTTVPTNERAEHFARLVSNPYLFRVGDTAVKVRYLESTVSLESRLSALFDTDA